MEFQHADDIMCLFDMEEDLGGILLHVNENSSDSSDYLDKWLPNNVFVPTASDDILNFGFDTDPLLSEAQIFDTPAILEGLEINPPSQLSPKKKHPIHLPVSPVKQTSNNGQPLKQSNSVKKENINNSDFVKNIILMERVPETVEVILSSNVSTLTFKEKGGCQMFMIQQMQVPDHYSRPERIHRVVSVTLFRICKNLEYCLPQIITNFGLKIHMCPLRCNKAFMHIADAKLHALQHMQLKPYKCDKTGCHWEFYTPSKLHRHRETHDKARNFVCPNPSCKRTFSTIYNLNDHKKKHNIPAFLPCTVPGCGLSFQNETQRKLHFKLHDRREAPFRCTNEKCQRAYFSKILLESHLRACKECDNVCRYPNCGKIFNNSYRLREHIRQHTGVKPYLCTFENCTWKFSTASKLKRHQSIHIRNRKYPCLVADCKKSFFRSEHLRDHSLTHVDKKFSVSGAKSASATATSSISDENTQNPSIDPLEQEQLLAVNSIQDPDEPASNVVLGIGLIADDTLNIPPDDINLSLQDDSLPLPDVSLNIPEISLNVIDDGNFSTVNLRDLD